ncbi:uncharacterized protein At3g61260-like [Coffea eugenioides]|uniref:uncharacterized protein At3g61260-like n=1 Tax=Coffea eugenioides TaxID=49369 RepID=UPI000F614ECA|nr:uncharacterized protein At3g61260-like [Coffea eugenioides]
MDILFKQLRTKYPNLPRGSKEGSSSTAKDGTTPPQKTQSFKGERKRSQSWLRRQFSGSMSRGNESTNEEEYHTAVAAAAFAVKSLEESRTRDERRGLSIRDAALPKIKSSTEDKAPVPDSRTKSTKFSGEVAMPNLDDPDRRVQISTEASEKMPEKAVVPVPPIKKKLSFADTQPEAALASREAIKPTKKASSFDRTFSRQPEIKEPKLEVPAPVLPPFLPGDTTIRQSPKKPGKGDTRADVWEEDEMARINEKYEKKRVKILELEEEEKKAAKRRLERTEAELDKRRARATHYYRSELERIESIARGARSHATENQRYEESKVKEKASKFRMTGKLPAAFWCF